MRAPLQIFLLVSKTGNADIGCFQLATATATALAMAMAGSPSQHVMKQRLPLATPLARVPA